MHALFGVLGLSFRKIINDIVMRYGEILRHNNFFCFHGKKYQEILRQMEKEKEVLLLEKEV